MTNDMITINGQQYHTPIAKGCPYYRIDTEKGIAAILPAGAVNYPTFKEHIISLSTFYSLNIRQTIIRINNAPENRLEVGRTATGERCRIMLPTYFKEGLNGLSLIYDHINNDETDDTDDNLRPVTRAQNSYNKKRAKNNTSGYKGVHRTPSKKVSYCAKVSKDYKTYSGGSYSLPEVAAFAYNELARTHHGIHGSLNPVAVPTLLELAKDPTILPNLKKDLATLDKHFGTGWSSVIAA